MQPRKRLLYLIFILGTVVLGLASRYFAPYIPESINIGLGDTLWALMMYWIMAFCFPLMRIPKLVLLSLSICFLVECSQLIQTDSLNAIRSNTLGALVLGKGFLWTDLVAYTIGVSFGALIERNFMFIKRKH